MPPSSDRQSQEPLLNLDPDLQGTGKSSRKKGKKKNESLEETAARGGRDAGLQNDLTNPSSILAQLRKSPSPPILAKSNISPPAFDAWNATPSQYEDAPVRDPTLWEEEDAAFAPQSHGDRSNGASIAGSPPDVYQRSEGHRNSFGHTSPSVSPRAAYRQLARRDNEYQSFGNYLGSSPNSKRPPSLYSHHHPPPPHQPQAHFYGAPELDFGMPRSASKTKDSAESAFYAFDTVPSSFYEGREGVGDVLLQGRDHGLDVYHVDRKRFEQIGRLGDLRGSVLQAAVLSPSIVVEHLDESQPLIAVIVHGLAGRDTNTSPPNNQDQDFGPTESMVQETPGTGHESVETSVEVYSLKTGAHIQTLLKAPRTEVTYRPYSNVPYIPYSTADLSIRTKGKHLTISSGKSGEVYIFGRSREDQKPPFRCIGKIWTKTLNRTNRNSSISSSSDADPLSAQSTPQSETQQPQLAIISLSDRWLAYVPPASSSQMTLHGHLVGDSTLNRTHGVASHTSPGEPQVTCQLDTPDAESFLNKVARDGAQTLMKGAQWVGNQSLQAWNNYWAKPPDPNQQRYSGSVPLNSNLAGLQNQLAFPPTHAQDSSKGVSTKTSATLVSILDLEKLSDSQHLKPTIALEPAATFSLPNGCSHLSFASDGLRLLTASSKGDVQAVWDLMRMVHSDIGKANSPSANLAGSIVREVARFTRMTEAKIIDVTWLEPRGKKLAIITDRGTVHIYSIPQSAFQWPPVRRPLKTTSASVEPPKSPSQETITSAERPQTATGSIASALGYFSNTTQPILATVRGRRPSTGSSTSTFGGFASTAGIGAKGGKAVAMGVNRSVSAAAVGTYQTIRHLGENRIALPSSSNGVHPSCVHWMTGKDQGALAITGGGIVKIYGIHESSNLKAGRRRPSVLGDRPIEFNVPRVSTSPRNVPFTQDSAFNKSVPQQGGSFWRSPPSKAAPRTSSLNLHPLSFAEIDTSAAYQPFHTDRRVNMYTFDQDPRMTPTAGMKRRSRTGLSAEGNSNDIWLFGEPIQATKISIGPSSSRMNVEVDDVGNEDDLLADIADGDDDFNVELPPPPLPSSDSQLFNMLPSPKSPFAPHDDDEQLLPSPSPPPPPALEQEIPSMGRKKKKGRKKGDPIMETNFLPESYSSSPPASGATPPKEPAGGLGGGSSLPRKGEAKGERFEGGL